MTSDHFGSLNKWHIYTSVILHCSSHKHRSVVLYLFINTYHMCSSKLTQLQTYIEHVLSSIVPHHTAWTYIQRPFTQCLCMLPMHLILFITSGHAHVARTWRSNNKFSRIFLKCMMIQLHCPNISFGDSSLLTYIYGESAISPSFSLVPPANWVFWPARQLDDIYFKLKS